MPPRDLERATSLKSRKAGNFRFDHLEIETDAGIRFAGVSTPLCALSGPRAFAPADDEAPSKSTALLEFAQMIPSPTLWIVRGLGDSHDHRWRLDDGAGYQRDRLAAEFITRELPIYLSLYTSGVALIVHLDLEPEDSSALRAAARDRSRDASGVERQLLQLACHFTTLSWLSFTHSSFVTQYASYARKASRATTTLPSAAGYGE